MIADAGSVVIVPFPFADLPLSKRRPALVLSRQRYNEEHGLTLLAMITTARRTQWAMDVGIADIEVAGLREPCVVRPRIGSVANDLIELAIGRLSSRDLAAIRESLEQLLGWRA